MFINGIHFQEYAKLEYGRLLWRVPTSRERLLRHWRDARHPHAKRLRNTKRKCLESWKAPRDQTQSLMRNCDNAV